jgi:hypothetical protein
MDSNHARVEAEGRPVVESAGRSNEIIGCPRSARMHTRRSSGMFRLKALRVLREAGAWRGSGAAVASTHIDAVIRGVAAWRREADLADL